MVLDDKLVTATAVMQLVGLPHCRYLRDQRLEPLGMTSTAFAYRKDMALRAATGYRPRFKISMPLLRIMVAVGALLITLPEHR